MISPLESIFFRAARHSITTNLAGNHDFAWKWIHWWKNTIKRHSLLNIMQYLVKEFAARHRF
ncbi:hypothetical protein Hanom_Chr08g00717981 [Helianthus anomalus]